MQERGSYINTAVIVVVPFSVERIEREFDRGIQRQIKPSDSTHWLNSCLINSHTDKIVDAARTSEVMVQCVSVERTIKEEERTKIKSKCNQKSIVETNYIILNTLQEMTTWSKWKWLLTIINLIYLIWFQLYFIELQVILCIIRPMSPGLLCNFVKWNMMLFYLNEMT